MDLKLTKLDIANEPLARKNLRNLEKFKHKPKKMKNENS